MVSGIFNVKTNPKALIQYESISDLLKSSNSDRRPASAEFDIFHFHELGGDVKKMMPPHRRKFCTMILLKNQKSGQISINQSKHTSLHHVLLFQGVEHIFSFVRDEEVEGTILMFNASFLLPYIDNLDETFPFFSVLHQNLFPLTRQDRKSFQQLIQLIHEEKSDADVVKPLLVALLEKAKKLYAVYASEEKVLSKKMRIVRKYKSLINNLFLENKEVRFYADQLNVSANYLNEIIKAETGISAKRHISERVLLEAKNLLLYSGLGITEISYVLGFSEPTHFTKFFKKETGTTPKSFQQQKP